MGLRNDYRVSTIIVLCKDCGNDVGLYPARHKCTNVKRPYLPTLCSSTSDWSEASTEDVPDLVASTPTSTTVTRQASDSSMESGKWNFFKSGTPNTPPVKNNVIGSDEDEPTSYFENYATHLKSSRSYNDMNESSLVPALSNGKKLWGRMKENEKWKELIADKKKDENKTSGKLWERIISATMSNSFEDQYHDSGPDSDDDDWEGETHVSRILREHHESKYKSLPQWLYDDRYCTPAVATTTTVKETHSNNSSLYRSKSTRPNGRRLWQTSEETPTTARERERQALRASSSVTSMSRTHSERMAVNTSLERSQRSILRYNNNEGIEDDNQIYASTAPRRSNTTRVAPAARQYYLNNNIPSSPASATAAKSKNYL